MTALTLNYTLNKHALLRSCTFAAAVVVAGVVAVAAAPCVAVCLVAAVCVAVCPVAAAVQ